MIAVTIVFPLLLVFLAAGLYSERMTTRTWGLTLLGILVVVVGNFPWR